MNNEPSGEYYDYTKTMKPERPWLVDYHQSLVYKTMNAYKDSDGSLKVYLNLGDDGDVFSELTDDWDYVSFVDGQLLLKDESGDGTVDTLTFVRK